MSRNEMKGLIRGIWHHMKVLWKGFLRMLAGTGTAGLIALAVYGYAMIPQEDGYVAVAEFAVATMLLALSLVMIHAMGGRGKAARRK